MTPGLETRRRALLIVYRRYLRAEDAWRQAQIEALSWFPERIRPAVAPIGNPGSSLRRLYDRRMQALTKLTVARQKLDEARRRSMPPVRIIALPAH